MLFSDELFLALNAWQNGWRENQLERERLAANLRAATAALPKKYRSASATCYRKRFLHHGDFVKVFLEDLRDEGVSSWTTDLRYAERFKGLEKPGAVTAAVFALQPAEEEVILNVASLWSDQAFVEAAESFAANNPDQSKALLNFRDRQGEVILNAPLRGSQIIRLSGASSPFDELCDREGIPEDQRDAHFSALVAKNMTPEVPRLIDEDQCRSVIDSAFAKLRAKVDSLLDRQASQRA